MRFPEFERIVTAARIGRYLSACDNNTRKAMTLYRLNIRLSQELFTIISCFEIALRNAVDYHLRETHGDHWLLRSVTKNNLFDHNGCRLSAIAIRDAIEKLNQNYSHDKLVAELGFGFWRYLFAQHQYKATGKNLLVIFPAKPKSTMGNQYNQRFIFNQLAQINLLRNRIAHHEPICFRKGASLKNTDSVRQQYDVLKQLFQWMEIDDHALFYGLDNVKAVCDSIDNL